MEWGIFITVIVAIYLVWYGFNFLFDLFIAGKPKTEATGGIHYKMSDLMAEEEKAQVVSQADYEPRTVEVHKTDAPTPKAPDASDIPAANGSGQSTALPLAAAPPPVPTEPAREKQPETNDWAAHLDQEEEIIEIPVQGQPIPVMDFIQSLKNEAKNEAQSIVF